MPCYWLLAEVRFVRHVTGDSRIVSKDRIFGNRFPRSDSLKESLQMRTHVVPIVAAIESVSVNRFLPQRWIVLGVPLFEVFFPQLPRVAGSVITGIGVNSSLRRMAKFKLPGIEEPFRSHDPGE